MNNILLERLLTNTFTIGFELEAISNELLTSDNIRDSKIYKLIESIFPDGNWQEDCSIDVLPINLQDPFYDTNEYYYTNPNESWIRYLNNEDDSYIVSKNEFEERQKENKIPVFTPFEWASPVLKFNPESISKIISLFDRGLGKLFYVNDSCGFHHHISFEGLTTNDAVWIICQLAVDDEGKDLLYDFTYRNADYIRTYGFTSTWSETEYLDDIRQDIKDNNFNQLVRDLQIDKYSILNPHINSTLEWRGPREFLESNNIDIVKQFYKHLWKVINWVSRAQDKKDINGMSKENFFKMLGDINSKPLINYGQLKMTKNHTLDNDTLNTVVRKVKEEPKILCSIALQDKRICDQVIQALFVGNGLGRRVEMLNPRDKGVQIIYDLAYKYIPLKMANKASEDSIYNTSKKTLDRMFNGRIDSEEDRAKAIGTLIPRINPQNIVESMKANPTYTYFLTPKNVKYCWEYLWDNIYGNPALSEFNPKEDFIDNIVDSEVSHIELIKVFNKAMNEHLDVKLFNRRMIELIEQDPSIIKYIDKINDYMLLYILSKGYGVLGGQDKIKSIKDNLLKSGKVTMKEINNAEKYILANTTHNLGTFDNID